MPAIITDQYRILNAETFVDSFLGIGENKVNNYYTFLGHPKPDNVTVSNYGDSNWKNFVPNPIDTFQQENFYYDSMLFLKKVTSDDVRRVVPRLDWQTGTKYEMYKHNYSNDNLTPFTKSTSLYGSNYFVVNSEFNVYLCINNGADSENLEGRASEYEPIHTDLVPQPAGDDGYLWKYLYTISPTDIVKFVTSTYIPLPKKWGDVSTATIKNAAVDGKIETIVIKNGGTGFLVKDAITGEFGKAGSVTFPIAGDGTGSATVEITNGSVSKVTVTGASGFTFASLVLYDIEDFVKGSGEEFEVIIPPKGGHGADIYRELGGFRVMIYSRYDNNVDESSDYIIDNDFSRVGLVKNPLQFGGTDLLNNTTATNLGALKLKPSANSGISTNNVTYQTNTLITQTVGSGLTAAALVASWDKDTGILKYYQPVGLSTESSYSYKKLDFDENAQDLTIEGEGITENLIIDQNFGNPDATSSITVGGRSVDLGQSFSKGKANPDVKKYSGEIIYIDNRAPISRTSSQKEEVKIVIEF